MVHRVRPPSPRPFRSRVTPATRPRLQHCSTSPASRSGSPRTARQRLAANTRPVEVALRDGARLQIRPILPSDRGKLADTQPGFSRESHYRRFFSAPPLSDKVVQYLVDVDYGDHFAWVALAADDPAESGVASARYIRERAAHDTAEVAFSVIDDYQGRGLGTILLGALGVAAAENGIRDFRARVLAENEPMRAILRRAGAQLALRRARRARDRGSHPGIRRRPPGPRDCERAAERRPRHRGRRRPRARRCYLTRSRRSTRGFRRTEERVTMWWRWRDSNPRLPSPQRGFSERSR